MLFVGLSACGLADRPFLRTRKELLRGALASGTAAFASRSADAAALPWERDVAANPLQARFLEKVRILLQDEADATQYGGELAPGGPPVGLPYLSLVPIVQMQNVLVRSRDAVADRKQWPALITQLSTGPFETLEFKRIFNQFSDNIYYASDTTEANAYLLGGATPSSAQTQQYLLRNEALKQVSELVDELRFLSTASEEQLQKLAPEEAQGAAAVEYLEKAIKVFADYLALAPPDQLKQASAALRTEARAPGGGGAGAAALLGAAAAALPHAALAEQASAALMEFAQQPAAATVFEPRGITPEDTFIFVLGCVPFVWAGIEFWRRIAVGDPFGTGSDSVIINDTSGNRTKAVRRVLGQDAIIAARLLFGIAGVSGAILLYAVADLVLNAPVA